MSVSQHWQLSVRMEGMGGNEATIERFHRFQRYPMTRGLELAISLNSSTTALLVPRSSLHIAPARLFYPFPRATISVYFLISLATLVPLIRKIGG